MVLRYGGKIISLLTKPFLLDKVPEPADHAETQAAPAAEDLPTAGQDASPRPDEHQRGHLGQATQEEHQPHQERRPGQPGAGHFR